MTLVFENPADYYESTGVEDVRLTTSRIGRLEFLRTQELLRRWLPPPPGRVLDVGGATGVHAEWLVRDGYEVCVIDPVERHVATVRSLELSGLAAEFGDARALAVSDDSVDAVLLLGPLYQLTEHGDRLLALREAARVLRPGGVVAAVGISRYAALISHARMASLTEELLPKLLDCLATGRHDPSVGFTTAHFHLPEELRAELRLAGLGAVSVHGVEGPAWPAFPRREAWAADDEDPSLCAALICARELADDSRMIAMSPHLLAIGHRPAPRNG